MLYGLDDVVIKLWIKIKLVCVFGNEKTGGIYGLYYLYSMVVTYVNSFQKSRYPKFIKISFIH